MVTAVLPGALVGSACVLPGGGHPIEDLGPPAPLHIATSCDLAERIDGSSMVLADAPLRVVCNRSDYPAPAGGRTIAVFFYVDYVDDRERNGMRRVVQQSFDQAESDESITTFGLFCQDTIEFAGWAGSPQVDPDSGLFDVDKMDVACE